MHSLWGQLVAEMECHSHNSVAFSCNPLQLRFMFSAAWNGPYVSTQEAGLHTGSRSLHRGRHVATPCNYGGPEGTNPTLALPRARKVFISPDIHRVSPTRFRHASDIHRTLTLEGCCHGKDGRRRLHGFLCDGSHCWSLWKERRGHNMVVIGDATSNTPTFLIKTA